MDFFLHQSSLFISILIQWILQNSLYELYPCMYCIITSNFFQCILSPSLWIISLIPSLMGKSILVSLVDPVYYRSIFCFPLFWLRLENPWGYYIFSNLPLIEARRLFMNSFLSLIILTCNGLFSTWCMGFVDFSYLYIIFIFLSLCWFFSLFCCKK